MNNIALLQYYQMELDRRNKKKDEQRKFEAKKNGQK